MIGKSKNAFIENKRLFMPFFLVSMVIMVLEFIKLLPLWQAFCVSRYVVTDLYSKW